MSKLTLVFLLLLPFFYLVRKNVTFHAVIPHGNHTEVFCYLTNVTKFRVLNPTIISITNWQRMDESSFYVEYTECLSQVPAVRNHARAHYRVHNDADGSHGLVSRHVTCFLADSFCLSTTATLRITKRSNREVGYREEISYSCPWPLAGFCFDEVAFQRRLITTKLKQIFSNAENNPDLLFPQNID